MNDVSTMIKIMEYMALGKPIVQFDLKEGRFSAQKASLYASKQAGARDFAEKSSGCWTGPKKEGKWANLEERESKKSLRGDIRSPNCSLLTKRHSMIVDSGLQRAVNSGS
jgi:hypothetical protein